MGCNNCKYKGKVKYKVSGCKLWECKVLGEVPFWTNKEKLLDTVKCESWVSKEDLQQEFEF
ncbi:MAG: hypothetical protein MJ179_02530 [Treponema sp.]|nr:hypothetical protein [Treponema sp.]